MVAEASETEERSQRIGEGQTRYLAVDVPPPPIDTNVIVSKIEEVGGFVTSGNTKFEGMLNEVDKGIKTTTKTVDTTLSTVKEVGENTKGLMGTLSTIAGPIAKMATETASTVTTVLAIDNVLKTRMDSLSNQVSNGVMGLATGQSNFYEKTKTDLSTGFKAVDEGIKSLGTTITNMFKFGTPDMSINTNDSTFARFFKNATTYIGGKFDPIVKSLTVGNYFTLNHSESDGGLANLLRFIGKSIITPIERLADVFKVSNQSIALGYDDSLLVKMFKTVMKNIVDTISFLPNAIKFGHEFMTISSEDSVFAKFFKNFYAGVNGGFKSLGDIFKFESANLTEMAADSNFAKFFKLATKSIISPIQSIKSVFDFGSVGLNEMGSDSNFAKFFKTAFKAVISPVESTWKSMTKGFDDVIKALSGLDIKLPTDFITTIKEGFSNVLSNIGQQLNQVNKIMDMVGEIPTLMAEKITGLFVPKDFKMVTDKFNSLKKTVDDKFGPILGGISQIGALFNTGQRDKFPDIDIDFNFGQLYGKEIRQEVKFKGDYLTRASLIIKPIITGFIFLWFLKEQYDWLHERNAILE